MQPSSGKPWPIIALVIGALLVLVGGALAIFKPTLPFFSSSGPITLKYWGLWETAAVMKPLIDQYEAAHPGVTIDYEQHTVSQYRETLLSHLASGDGPDIFRIHNTWLPELNNELDQVPDSVYSAADFASTFYPEVTSDLSSGGKYYAIPLETDGLALLYNTDMFASAGITSPPQTWTDIIQTDDPKLTKYNADGSIAVGGIALGTSTNVDNFSDILGLLFLQNNVEMVKNGQVNFQSEVNTQGRNLGADALDFYVSFAKKTASQPAVWSESLPSSTQAFATGQAAMIIIPSFRIPDVISLINQSGKTINFKVTPVPQALPAAQSQPTYWASYWAEAVAKNSPNKAAAWDFLKFLSSKDSLTKLYTEEAKARPFGEPPSRVDLADLYKSDPYVGAYINSAHFAKSWYLASGTGDNGLDDQMVSYFGDAVTSVLDKGVTSTDALKTAAAGAMQVLSRYGLVTASSGGQ